MAKKPDADQIREVLADLRGQSWLGKQRRAWPRYAYHYSDVRNVARILREGRLLSRQRSQEEDLLEVDAASAAVLDQSPWAHRYVRLYFRPRTPVQWHHEGHKTPEDHDPRYSDAHCPVPVFLLFDLEELLTDEGCRFSDGNLARRDHRIGDNAEFLTSLKFQDIYRDKALPDDPIRKRELIFAMLAEVLFEQELDLQHLRHVVCRTGAERDTLLHLLGTSTDRWRGMIRLEHAGERLFHREGAYITSVQLVDGRVVVRSEPGTGRPFDILIRVMTLQRRTFTRELSEPLGRDIAVPLPTSPERALVRVNLNGELAFRAVVSSRELF